MSEAPTNARHNVSPLALDMLVCPLTKTRLTLSADKGELISVAARLAFPIVRGVPLLSLDEARSIEGDELAQLTGRQS
jgi:uncharacterized protein YbaR (Trm112 family)